MIAQEDKFDLTPVGPFSTRIANLEDMIKVALSDGSLDESEKPLIIDFAKKLSLTNSQFQLIFSEVKNQFLADQSERACPSCSAKISSNAKFCPECGQALEDSDKDAATPVDYDIPSSGIAIEFAESTASGFVDAIRKAAEAPEHAECRRGSKTWYLAAWPLSKIAEAAKLVECLKGMRNRRVWVDGRESRWDDVFGYTWCSSQRDSAYRPVEYCFGIDESRLNIWGCRNARLDWTKWSSWFSYGTFKKEGLLKGKDIFVFDKKRIRHELETNLYRFRFCPNIDHRLIESVLKHLPDQVEASANGDWGYREDYEESPGALRIKQTISEGGYTYTKEFFASGVVPRSAEVGLRILKQAFSSAEANDPGIQTLLAYREQQS